MTEVNFDVFTANKRSVMYIKHEESGQIVAFVAIGALLVGAIGWSKKVGDKVDKGEELGWFAYGGSTVVTVFPAGLIKYGILSSFVLFLTKCLDLTTTFGQILIMLWRLLFM